MVAVYALNPSMLEVEAGGPWNSRSVWFTELAPGQSEPLHRETLSMSRTTPNPTKRKQITNVKM